MGNAALLGLVSAIVIVVWFFAGLDHGEKTTMREALDRGFAERCVGTTTIYWRGECPEARP